MLFGWAAEGAKAEETKPEAGGPSRAAPTRSQRSQCWASRDAYFACLDERGLWLDGLAPQTEAEVLAIDPKAILRDGHRSVVVRAAGATPCSALREAFEASCLASWAGHFSSMRVKELQTQYLRDKIAAQNAQLRDEDFWVRAQRRQSPAPPASAPS